MAVHCRHPGIRKSDNSAMVNNPYKDNWTLTATGRQFFPFRPWDSEIVLEDIAHGLAHTCRFSGQCRHFYSVAQHSVLVSMLTGSKNALAGLLHDASEAYIGDLAQPIKEGIASYKLLERRILERIGEQFNVLLFPTLADIKRADREALRREAAEFMPRHHLWDMSGTPSGGIVPLMPQDAKALFLDRFTELTT